MEEALAQRFLIAQIKTIIDRAIKVFGKLSPRQLQLAAHINLTIMPVNYEILCIAGQMIGRCYFNRIEKFARTHKNIKRRIYLCPCLEEESESVTHREQSMLNSSPFVDSIIGLKVSIVTACDRSFDHFAVHHMKIVPA